MSMTTPRVTFILAPIHSMPRTTLGSRDTLRLVGWISGRIVSFQPDTDIQNLLLIRIWMRLSDPKRFTQYFEDSGCEKNCHF